jgi:hypothetical protein
MTSTFTWLDYSEHERRKMLDVIHLFRERDTRDELGIGSVRDAFADLLFPGTSTIQTRARYFFFVPWIYLELEERRAPSAKVAERARRQEIALIEALVDSRDVEGVIGRRARGRLQRLPSNVYWQGLGTLGIRLFPGSQDQYHRALDAHYQRIGRSTRLREEEPADGYTRPNWHAQLPAAPDSFPEEASLALTRVEADYLRERILSHAPATLFAVLADVDPRAAGVEYPWMHPQYQAFPEHIREQLEHGRNFSEVIHGAALLYNLMLAEKTNDNDLVVGYRELIRDWSALIEKRQSALAAWDVQRFWEIVVSGNPRVPKLTRMFVDSWLSLVQMPGSVRAIADSAQARAAVHERERFLKRGLARLDNDRALELWLGGGAAAGTARLDYRWGVAERMLRDIHIGLSEGAV